MIIIIYETYKHVYPVYVFLPVVVTQEIQSDPTFYNENDGLPNRVMPQVPLTPEPSLLLKPVVLIYVKKIELLSNCAINRVSVPWLENICRVIFSVLRLHFAIFLVLLCQFLRQLTHEGNVFNRVRAKSMVETVQVGDRYYHTIATSIAARKFLEATPSFQNSILESGNPKMFGRKGTLVKIRFNTEEPSECPVSRSSFEAPPDVVMVDARRSSGSRKMGRKRRCSARMSVPMQEGNQRVGALDLFFPIEEII